MQDGSDTHVNKKKSEKCEQRVTMSQNALDKIKSLLRFYIVF